VVLTTDHVLTELSSVQLSATHSTAHLRSSGSTGSIHSPAVDRTTPEECFLPLVKLQSRVLGRNTKTGLDNELCTSRTFNKYVCVYCSC